MADTDQQAYQAPANDAARPDAREVVDKPWRVWILQAYAALLLVVATVTVPWVLWSQRWADIRWASWAPHVLLITVPAALLVLSLQRKTPQSGLVAPISAVVWWSYMTYVDYTTFGRPSSPAVEQYKFQDVSLDTEATLAIMFRGIWLLFVLSLMLHDRTRDYLNGRLKPVLSPPDP